MARCKSIRFLNCSSPFRRLVVRRRRGRDCDIYTIVCTPRNDGLRLLSQRLSCLVTGETRVVIGACGFVWQYIHTAVLCIHKGRTMSLCALVGRGSLVALLALPFAFAFPLPSGFTTWSWGWRLGSGRKVAAFPCITRPVLCTAMFSLST